MLTSVLFSLAPALQAAGADPAGGLKEGARNMSPGHARFRSALVVGQITLGLVLLVGAELLMASFLHLTYRDPGFRTDHLLTFDIALSEVQYNGAGRVAFCDRLLERLRAIPGVEAAATGTPLPLQGRQMSVAFNIEDRPAAVPDRPVSNIAIVTPGYFGAMGIPIFKGREFTERDKAEGPPVLIVNEAFARKYFPGQDVIGKRIQPGAHDGQGPRMREIVGVVGNAKQVALSADPDPIYYFPHKQLSWGIGTIVLRTAVPPLDVESAARTALASLDRQAPMYQVRTGEELSASGIAPSRFLMMLMGSFAAIALMLTVVGLYGVLSYTVARRRREIGVRIALGAGRKQVLGLVFRQAAQLVAAGLILGLAGAVAAGRLLETTVFGLRPGDPLMLLGACCALIVASIAAAYIPAARAASVEPMQALRSE
ncbi:MAG TPA: FtsX-like permease family protein [Bryobacteraceae bacterium]|nr:FtsX-like permease family protein [Bryobacteraceae bacterium]